MSKRKSRFFISIVVFLTVFLSLSDSNEATMIKLSLEDLSVESEAIVIGQVQDIQCHWSMDQSVILTVVMLKVHESLKGHIANELIFIQYSGGEIGELGLRVSDAPEFHPEEKVLVFIKSIKNATDPKNSMVVALNFIPSYEVFGDAQGKYSIDQDGIASKSGYTLMGDQPDQDRAYPLEKLKIQIKNILQKQSKKRERTRDKIKH